MTAEMSKRSKPASGRAERVPRYHLRPVALEDVSEVVRQRLAMFRELDDLPEASLRAYAPRFARWFRAELRRGRLTGFLAEDGSGEPVAGGLVWLQPRRPTPRFRHPEVPYIFSMFTEPRHRRRRLAERIVRKMIRDARREGFPRVELHASEMGQPLYARLGFRPTNEMRLTLSPRRRGRKSSS